MRILKRSDSIPNELMCATHKRFCGEMETHGHDFFELEMILEGEGSCLVDGVPYALCPNRLVFLTPVNLHAVKGDLRLINVMFQIDHMGELLPSSLSALTDSPVYTLSPTDSTFLQTVLLELVRVHESDRIFAQTLLRCVLQKLVSLSPTAVDRKRPLAQRAMLYVLEQFRRGVTLEKTASYLGFSPSYFSDCFQKQAGQSFQSFLDDVRFSHAKNLLLLTDLPIGEVYQRAGFSDYANFSRRFKKRYQCSPGEYRKQAR